MASFKLNLKSALISGATLAAVALALGGCNMFKHAKADDEEFQAAASAAYPQPLTKPHAPGAPHQFYYYPNAQVYRDCEANRWIWIEGQSWQSGVTLPARIKLDSKPPYAVELRCDDPWLEHRKVAQAFPARTGRTVSGGYRAASVDTSR